MLSRVSTLMDDFGIRNLATPPRSPHPGQNSRSPLCRGVDSKSTVSRFHLNVETLNFHVVSKPLPTCQEAKSNIWHSPSGSLCQKKGRVKEHHVVAATFAGHSSWNAMVYLSMQKEVGKMLEDFFLAVWMMSKRFKDWVWSIRRGGDEIVYSAKEEEEEEEEEKIVCQFPS